VIQWVLGLSHSMTPPRRYHMRVCIYSARDCATGLPIQPGLLCPLGDQTHELHGTGVKSASLDQLQIFSELLEKHHFVIALCVLCVLISHYRYNPHIALIGAPDGSRRAQNCLETRRKAFRVLSHSRARYIELSVKSKPWARPALLTLGTTS
jgi:hypothetical protein